MQNYTILKEIGSGAYGCVYKAMQNSTNKVVAIKKLFQQSSWSDAKSMVELKSFKQIKHHKNIVSLYELFREKDGTLYFVFEYISGGDMNQLLQKHIKAGTRPQYDQILSYSYQILQGIEHIHNSKFIHRDLKQENILLQDDVPKIADLGCAKEVRGRTINNTVYIGTRWYRSIELLLHDPTYSYPNDIWAVGCIIAELFTLTPLFPGNSELDMLNMITEQLGPVSTKEYPEFEQLSQKIGFIQRSQPDDNTSSPQGSFQRVKERLLNKLPGSTEQICDLLAHMLQLNPKRRWTATQCLQHPIFQQIKHKFNNQGIQVEQPIQNYSYSNNISSKQQTQYQTQNTHQQQKYPNNHTESYKNSKQLLQKENDDIFADLDFLQQL